MASQTLTIATRESPLALWQANWVKNCLEKLHPWLTVRLLGMTTKADKMLDLPLTKVGGKGLFVKELEDALYEGHADIAVHSMKDVPMQLPDGLCIPVTCQREDPRDVFVSNDYANLLELPAQAMIGTSSLRRQSQIYALNTAIRIDYLRGNVNTRLAKLDQGNYAAIILAAAGLKRLNLENRIRSYLSLDESLPAPGQGVLGIECRNRDDRILSLIDPLNHMDTFLSVAAERAMCKMLNGGCQAPVAAFAEIRDEKILLKGLVGKPDGTLILRSQGTAEIDNAELLGRIVAEDLLGQGAEDIIRCATTKN